MLIVCWTCPKCWYSGYQADFKPARVTPQLVEQILTKKVLKPAKPILGAAKEFQSIPAWVRFDLLAQVLQLRQGAKAEEIAWAWLRAAHCQRFVTVNLYGIPDIENRLDKLMRRASAGNLFRTDYEEAVRSGAALEKLADDGANNLSSSDRAIARLQAAIFYKGRGEDPDVRRIVTALRKGKALEPGMEDALKALEVLSEREKLFIGRSIPFYEEAVRKQEVGPADLIGVRYLIGELYRKVGDNAKALQVLEPLSKETISPNLPRAWITDAILKAKGCPLPSVPLSLNKKK